MNNLEEHVEESPLTEKVKDPLYILSASTQLIFVSIGPYTLAEYLSTGAYMKAAAIGTLSLSIVTLSYLFEHYYH